jgi:prepilin-type N-terminal cleavage/methylation domain-containing protein/prepilin-type processing-associated H-X9-DG protein
MMPQPVRTISTHRPSGKAAHLNAGFTMVELLVVIGIIVVLVAIVLPSLSAAKKAGYNANCLGNLRQIMLANNVYILQNNNKLPYSGRNIPYMGFLDEWELCLFQNTSTNVKYAHCPADRFTPSFWAVFWRAPGNYNRPMNISDHLPQVQPLVTAGTIPAEANYSYLWFAKMYYDKTGNTNSMHDWSVNDIWYPSKLITVACTHTTTSTVPYGQLWGGTGVNSGFLDGHAEFVPWSLMSGNTYDSNFNKADGSKNLDWTNSGTSGNADTAWGRSDGVGVHAKDIP